MNTENLKQQPLFQEPAFIDGVAGMKVLPAEPQFITGAVSPTDNLTPLYADPHVQPFQNENQLPLYGEEKKPIYSDQVGAAKLFPGQENFIGKQIKFVDGKEVITTGGVVQAAYVPPHHGEEHKSEYVHLTKENQHVQVPPDAEHLHIKAERDATASNVDKVIRIKPDGRVQVTTEKVGEQNTEHLKKEHVTEKEHVKTKKVSKKKKHVDEKAKHDVPTETTTVVKVSEHEPGTTGKLGKHDDTHHHGKKEHVDKHHGTDETKVKVNKGHHAVPMLLGKDEHCKNVEVDTHHGTDQTNPSKEEETKVDVDKAQGSAEHVNVTKEEHSKTKHLKTGKTGKKKRSSGRKHKVAKTETTTVVKSEEGNVKEGKLGHDKTETSKHHHEKKEVSKHHHPTDESKIKIEKEKHHHPDESKIKVEKEKHHHPDEHVTEITTAKHEKKDVSKHHHPTDESKIKIEKEKHHPDESKIKVEKEKHHHPDEHVTEITTAKHEKTDVSKHHHPTDESKIKIEKEKHHHPDESKIKIDKEKHHHSDEHVTDVKVHDKEHHLGENVTHVRVHDKRPSDTTHVRAGIVTKPQDNVHETHRTEEQGLVQQLRTTLAESDTPNMDVLGELLLRAEVLLHKSSNQKDIDPEARKTLQDISTLLNTAKQMERHKGISDRLQKISDECQKSLSNMKGSDTPATVKTASREAVDFINLWRPVFQLLIRSRDFRQLFVDSLRIAKRVVSRNEVIMDDLSQRFIEGESAQGIKESAKIHRDQNVDLSMTNEEWEYLQDEIQSVMVILARNPQYHDAINRLFTLLDMFNNNMKETLPASSGGIEPHALNAKKETEELVATFTGRETLKEFKIRLRRLAHAFNSDPEFQRYFTDVKTFILSSKSEEEVRSEAFSLRSRELIKRGRYLVDRSKDSCEFDNFIAISNLLMENIKNDEYVKELRTRAGIVRSDLTYIDTEGRTKIDVDMLVKLQHVLMPVLAETFKKIQIPRIENSDKRLDFWVDNIVLCGYDIFPDNIKFHIERDSELSIREVEQKGSHTRLVMHLDKLRTEIKNIEFYFKRKTFPSISDSGLVTFRIPENGAHLGIFFTIEDRPGETHPRLTEGYADFTIRKMDIEFDKSTLKHDVLLPIATTVMKPIIQSKIEKAVETNLTNILKQLGDRLTLALGELNRPTFFPNMVKDTIKLSEPAQVMNQRKEILE